ncbi:hypothetical protein CASFOL_039302 [Castilleja foliolosa]|uniref:F-box domain-containing protein n=1 Tax=Castilleja foliolosa TaxID=1961234 RepID=A0ABD3BI78_9LAMI
MAKKGKGGKSKGKGKQQQQTHRKNTPTDSDSDPDDRDLPEELISNILSRLPVKSLLRFRCTSKQWHDLVIQPTFISAHLSRSSTALLIYSLKASSPAVNGEPQPYKPNVIYAYRRLNTQLGEFSSTIERIHSFPGSDLVGLLKVVGTAQNGVVCIVEHKFALKFTLWNPMTRSVLKIREPHLPKLETLYGASAGFGYDPSSNKYAIIRIVSLTQEPKKLVANIFNFQKGRWDRLNNDGGIVPFRALPKTCEVVVNGVPYWMGKVKDDELGKCQKLGWFDMRRSMFILELFPWSKDKLFTRLGEIREGFLGAIVFNKDEWQRAMKFIIDVWTRDDEYGRWSRTYRVDFGKTEVRGRFLGFHGDAEMVIEDLENPYLTMMKPAGDDDDVPEVKDSCYLEGAFRGYSKTMRYRESLTCLPKIGSS